MWQKHVFPSRVGRSISIVTTALAVIIAYRRYRRRVRREMPEKASP